MKIKIELNNKEKEALIKMLGKVDPETDYKTVFNTKETGDGIASYDFDGENTLKLKVPKQISILLIKYIGKFGKTMVKMVTDLDNVFTNILDKQKKEEIKEQTDELTKAATSTVTEEV